MSSLTSPLLTRYWRISTIALALLALLAISGGMAGDALAQSTCTPAGSPYDICSCPPSGGGTVTGAGNGRVSSMMVQVTLFLDKIGENLYNALINSTFYSDALNAVMMMVVVMFGLQVLLGLENFTPSNIFLKLFKMGFIVWMVTPGGWSIFQAIVGKVFWGTMLEVIEQLTSVTMTAVSGSTIAYNAADLAKPLQMFDGVINQLLSYHFIATIKGVAITGTKGVVMAMFLAWGGGQLILAIVTAVFKYVKAMVGLWFLFAIGPLFLLCSLFQRTQPLFQGWLEKMISFTLEVILLFAFLGFFMILVIASLEPILAVTWCQVHIFNIVPFVDATAFYWWRPVEIPGIGVLEEWGRKSWTGEGYDNHGNLIQFPISTIDIAFFVLTTHIAWKYNDFVTLMATTLSMSGLRLGSTVKDAQNFLKAKGVSYGGIKNSVASAFSRGV